MKHLYIKTLIICAMGLLANSPLMAQQSVTIDASQVVSTFSYQDSNSSKNFDMFGSSDYNAINSGAYSLGYRRTTDMGWIFRGSLGMRRAGATTIIDETNYRWDFQYMTLQVGAGYEFITMDKLGVYATLSPYAAYMLKANQRLDNEDFDIKKSGEINAWDFGLQLTPGVQFVASDFVTLYGEFSMIQGLKNLESEDNGQNSYNVGYAFTLGLAFTIQ
ncbi:porin family protein [Reichenbachiella ulvae]|uniref:Porin family protein n=1 Tax=Reichenbachiella ulvae TaxID=2980104 RepID=A0ABT3CUJ1_9BACT|nr:porin family protein [Reichenbachiella ulvae]MCV9387150.1 porin family protein [Reichenbachiella ulvae]